MPDNIPVTETQRLVRALWNAFAAVVAASHRPRFMAILTAQIAPLQKEGQTTARPVHAGERDNLTD